MGWLSRKIVFCLVWFYTENESEYENILPFWKVCPPPLARRSRCGILANLSRLRYDIIKHIWTSLFFSSNLFHQGYKQIYSLILSIGSLPN